MMGGRRLAFRGRSVGTRDMDLKDPFWRRFDRWVLKFWRIFYLFFTIADNYEVQLNVCETGSFIRGEPGSPF
jgi:hypothetical protein